MTDPVDDTQTGVEQTKAVGRVAIVREMLNNLEALLLDAGSEAVTAAAGRAVNVVRPLLEVCHRDLGIAVEADLAARKEKS